jgi:Sec-independent protein translocase protein TatA
MGSIGATEILILLVIAAFLFGPTLLAFWLGYTIGKKRSTEAPPQDTSAEPPSEESIT